jgi:hypothetical protein
MFSHWISPQLERKIRNLRKEAVMNKKMVVISFLASLVIFLGAIPIQASPLVYDFTYEFSGGDDPSGPAPWIRATFTDDGSGGVELKLEDLSLTDTEFVTQWYFNFDPSLDLTSLSIIQDVPSSTVVAEGISWAENAFSPTPGAGGFFDILIEFGSSNKNDGEARFKRGSVAFFDITYTGLGSFSAYSFDFESAPNQDGFPVFKAAAHVQGIDGPEGSGKVAPIPEPATMLLFGTGLVGLAGLGRKKFFNKR